MPRPPSLNPVRQRGTGPVYLPPEGRKGPAPRWPLGACSDAEAVAWVGLWRTPQAVVWERLGWTRVVARYCRVVVRAEALSASPALMAQTAILEDRLGLTPKAMRLLLWVIAEDEVAEKRAESSVSARGRIRAV